ncbi:MAG: ACT domain-containing protein [Ruminococcus sp.]|nr:ACT domain-containing protein [Ruminococcus sp.]
MTAEQLSIFLENKPQQLVKVTETLAEGGIDIRAMSLADTQDFGIVRMLVSDCAKAKVLLNEKGLMSTITKVLCAEVPDHPGGLSEITRILGDAKINIDYLYACITEIGQRAYIVLHVSDEAAAQTALTEGGIVLVDKDALAKIG